MKVPATTLKTVLGIVRPRAGAVIVDGEDVTARSVPGQGSAFVVTLPVSQQATQPTAASTPKEALPVDTLSGRGPA